MLWPVLAERATVVIELFVIYKAVYSLYNGSFWCPEKFHNIFFLEMFFIVLHSNSNVNNYDSFWLYDNMRYSVTNSCIMPQKEDYMTLYMCFIKTLVIECTVSEILAQIDNRIGCTRRAALRYY